ncbi:MAG: DUF721 domain-containing protein [Alphaproteobacteria bacterium]|nr:DUF721 domain-containing protein [Alphaproteobacteria bacterium]MBU0798082.1 DUF721 domain-containing protein [Alphaproteobacteria bacterium]MBU0888782.1 DUF721 domain-containing protein [Alphaproteobacteria bacterium]MBU1812499.1 DUF721 domain-containing protein [Alphaproteobacteria bacterium]
MTEQKPADPSFVRYRRLSAVAAPTRLIARKLLGGKAAAEASVMLDWPAIVGQEIASYCLPRKLARGRGVNAGAATLHLTVDSAFALEVQYITPQIIERVNTYLGYRGVERLLLHQAALPLPEPSKLPPLRPLTADERQTLEIQTAPIADDSLRAALQRLGAALRGSAK